MTALSDGRVRVDTSACSVHAMRAWRSGVVLLAVALAGCSTADKVSTVATTTPAASSVTVSTAGQRVDTDPSTTIVVAKRTDPKVRGKVAAELKDFGKDWAFLAAAFGSDPTAPSDAGIDLEIDQACSHDAMSDGDVATLTSYFGSMLALHHKDVGQLRVDIAKLHAETRGIVGCD